MSLSAYDIYMRLDGLEQSSRESDTVSDGEIDNDNLVLSSLGSQTFFTLDDSISLNSSVLQDRICTITLHPDIVAGMEHMRHDSNNLDERGECTILSSNPSGTSIPPAPEASQDIFILSPHPQFTADGIHSLSTTNTELFSYERVFRERTFEERTDDDKDSSSSASSVSMDVDVLSTRGGSVSGGFEDGAFERVASHLMFDSSTVRRGKDWFTRLVSESDWDRFRVTAKDFLSILSEDSRSASSSLLPLPPMIPHAAISASSKDFQEVPYSAEDYIPSDFICGICKDVIVGACILDCSCHSSAVCASCWDDECNQKELANRMDFVCAGVCKVDLGVLQVDLAWAGVCKTHF